MGTGIGEYCKRCGEQLNYDDGFEDGFCNRCYHIVKFETKNVPKKAFSEDELEIIAYSVASYTTSEEGENLWKKLRSKFTDSYGDDNDELKTGANKLVLKLYKLLNNK